jgi:hypothetical protein
LEGFSRDLPSHRDLPVAKLFLLSAFQRLSFGDFNFFNFELRQSLRTVLIRSSNRLPVFGNCDSPRFETFLNYLIRLGTVSNRSLPPDSSFAFDTRERARGTGEFCLAELALRFRGVGPTSLTRLFPGHPGLS